MRKNKKNFEKNKKDLHISKKSVIFVYRKTTIGHSIKKQKIYNLNKGLKNEKCN